MREAAWIALAPFVVTYKLASWLWTAASWLRKCHEQWQRKPAYGDAHWANRRQLKQSGNLSGNGFVVGRLNGKLVRTKDDYSCLMFGRPGSGKSLTMGATINEASGETLLVFDPPGALRTRFKGELEAKGYAIQEINLNAPLDGVRYDICACLDGAATYDRQSRLNQLAELATAELHDGGRNSEHFATTSRIMIEQVLGWLHHNDRNNANFQGVAEVLLSASAAKRCEIFRQIVASGDSGALMAVNMWEAAESAKGGEASGFRSSVTRALEPWMTQAYRDLTTGQGARFDWEEVLTGAKPSAVFLTGGVARSKEVKAFVRVFFGQAAGTVGSLFAKAGRLPRNVRLMIDEGVVLGRCEPMLTAVEEMRKSGVAVFIGYQSFGQLAEIWGKREQVLRDCCDMIVSGGSKTAKDYLEISQLIGSRTVKAMSKNSQGTSESETGRHLMPIEEFFALEVDEQVCLLGSLPALLRKPYIIKVAEAVY